MAADPDNAATIASVCAGILSGDEIGAARLLRDRYPFTLAERQMRRASNAQAMSVFVRDGFVDRYSNERLVFPGMLRALSLLLPQEFPFHPNWKMTECHPAYWTLFPTIDHVIPIARGGADEESNWVTTSMLRNSLKSNWTLEDLGWTLHEPGKLEEWDGLVASFLRTV